MVLNEEDKVERFVVGLPNNIQGNVIAVEPTQLQDAIRIANNLMEQKFKGYARSAENKRRLKNNTRDNRGQQPVFKQHNVGGQNVARAYTAGNNEKKGGKILDETTIIVMAISIISVSSNSSKDSVGTPAGRVILFSTIPTTILDATLFVTSPTTHIDTTPIPIVSPTIPPSSDYTPASPDYLPASDTEFDPFENSSSDHIPPLPATSPFFHRPMNLQKLIYLIHHHHLPMIHHSLRLPFLPKDHL
ncbi:hypothetical protein Tco_1212143 [Tanacetum coccineum]